MGKNTERLDEQAISHRLPEGAEVQSGGGTHFRVWAPRRERVEVVLERQSHEPLITELEPESAGYFSGFVRAAGAGDRYRYRLDGGAAYPDSASRFQPDGPHGSSQVVDPAAFRWTDQEWRGLGLEVGVR